MKPSQGRKLVVGALAVAAAGTAAALAADEGLRKQFLGSAKALGDEISNS